MKPTLAARLRVPCRLVVFLALWLLAPACGGGGGGGSGGEPSEPAPTAAPSAEERARAILEDCALEAITAFEAVAGEFDGTLDGEQAPTPDFEVTGIDLIAVSIDWTLDADADGQVDLMGTMRFFDAGGSPAFPFSPVTLLALLAGTADLPTLLATVPDGTRVVVDYATVGSPVPVSGTLDTTFVQGLASTVSGGAGVDGAACDTGLSFQDLAAAALYAPNPAGTFDLLVTATDGTLEGTVTLNGDGTATIDVLLDATDHLVWDYDLTTGTLTLRP